MTENLLGLRENPFAAGHDPRLIHLTPEREEMLARLKHALGGGEPFLLVTGEPGIGKTSVVCQALEIENASPAFVTHPAQKRNELLEEICIRFEVELPESPSMPQALARLERHLCGLCSRGEKPVLVIDEAQDLTPDLLEELRLLSNLEDNGKPLLQIVLVGLPEFEGRLAQPRLANFQQRIATRCRVGPLSAEETERYIHHRVAVAGGDGPERFPRETCVEIHRLARGVPRAINTIAGQAILRASRESMRSVSPAHVQAAGADSWLRSVSEGQAQPRPAPRESPPVPKEVPAPPRDAKKSDDPDVKEWVSRFVDPTRPLRWAGASGMDPAPSETPPPVEEKPAPAAPKAAVAPRAPAKPQVPVAPRAPVGRQTPVAAQPAAGAQTSRAPAASRASVARRHIVPDTGRLDAALREPAMRARLGLALALVLLVGVVAFQLTRSTRGRSPQPASGTAPVALGPVLPSRSPTTQTTSSEAASVRRLPKAAVAARADTAARPKIPRRRLGLEAGVFINFDRAHEESAILAERTGLPVRVREVNEDGVVLYRIVVGSFGSRRKAEQAADDLLIRGAMDQARVVTLEPDSTVR